MNLVRDSYKLDGQAGPTNQGARRSNDTRNNWLEVTLVAKCRYMVFGKQKTIDACMAGFMELTWLGFRFGVVGFAGNHVQLSVDVPKRYSVGDAISMLKSRSAKRIFAQVPNFRKRYPRGSFWSRYEHHQSVGKDREASDRYLRSQPRHHGIESPYIQKDVFEFFAEPLTSFA